MDILLALLGAGSAGGFSTIGTAVNARLKTILYSPIAAATINFLVGFSILTLLLGLGIFKPYKLDLLSITPWWAFLGGLLGAIFVTLSTLIVPKLGLTTTTLVVVFSQIFMSMVIDQLGWFGAIKYPITTPKILGIATLIVAIVINQLDRNYSHKNVN
ncbi:DMT family transporter [Anabaena catenula]|uniref:DMT family transporter n=1 Tax=Anabaena catenula FACHB-362 TaxID=2692877 RepID=A0ABR8JEX8_9NOST|nr:DMT family transporter [Anabaena catenula]MBD2695206.1 DMT family transporter [Anabaena catenula FACHB-362]